MRPRTAKRRDARQAGPAADAVPMLTRPLPALSPRSRPQAAGAVEATARLRPTPGWLRSSRGRPRPAPARNAAAGKAADDAPPAATQPSAAAAQRRPRLEDPEREGKVEWGQDNVVITFATNSSYFPPGTDAQAWPRCSAAWRAGERYRVRLEVGVSGSDTVVGATTAEEARRYNQWLAERRLSRVREWLDENASDRQLEIEPTFQTDDSSRRVVVRVAPVS